MWRKAVLFAALLLALSVVFAQPAQAQTVNTIWRAEFYNNPNLQGSPEFTRQDSSIAFNWGTGQPDPRINADNFSVRWATDVPLSAGTYRVFARADDNVRVTFNFGLTPVIDTFASGQVDQLVTGDFTVGAAGTYHIQVDYRELTGPAFVYVSIVNLAGGGAPPPGFPGASPTLPPVVGGQWTAQYYANQNLLGDPTVIVGVASPSFNVGSGSPFTAIPADNWSARFTSVQNLAPGTYNITVRVDDGVRVFVNGVLVINQWQLATGQTYSANIALPGGPTTFVVEYFEATGEAFLEYNFSQVGGTGQPVPQPPVSPTGVTATVTAFRLNVRNAPNAITGSIITRVNRGETYSVLGRNDASTWYLVDVRGTQGWVSAGFVNISPFGANIPVAGAQPPAPAQPPTGATGNQVQATPFNVVIRQGPGTQFTRIGLFPVGQVANVIGRNASNTWWQVDYNGLVGWVSGQFAIIAPNANIGAIPITQ